MYGYGFRPNNRLFSGGGGGGANPLWNGLAAYYTADNTPNDALGNYNGTLINGATYGTGIINQGFALDGVNDYVSISPTFGSSFSTPTSAHSYSAWVYPPVLAGIYDFIIQNGKNDMGTALSLRQNDVRFWYQGGFNGAQTTGSLINIASWNHIVSTYDGAGGLKIYINDSLALTTTISWTDGTGTCNTYLGSYLGSNHYMNGGIDEVGAWTRVLTPTEVTELYNSGAALQYSN